MLKTASFSTKILQRHFWEQKLAAEQESHSVRREIEVFPLEEKGRLQRVFNKHSVICYRLQAEVLAWSEPVCTQIVQALIGCSWLGLINDPLFGLIRDEMQFQSLLSNWLILLAWDVYFLSITNIITISPTGLSCKCIRKAEILHIQH